ncbi:unnamed protein product [Caenorhabditis sp. 36 PRJEB53466]|nr:unnamed protein product [Caenorhabditis sp. 36 PRJEB53466]
MSRFSGKVALVTGNPGTPWNPKTALLLAQEGAKVTVTGRNARKLEATRLEIRNARVSKENILVVAVDLNSEAGQDELIASTVAKEGRESLKDVEVYDKNMEIHVKSIITLTQKAIRHLAKNPMLIYLINSQRAPRFTL